MPPLIIIIGFFFWNPSETNEKEHQTLTYE